MAHVECSNNLTIHDGKVPMDGEGIDSPSAVMKISSFPTCLVKLQTS